MANIPVHWKRIVMVGWDLFAWAAAFIAFVLIRYDFELNERQWIASLAFVVSLMVTHMVVGFASHQYLGRSKVASYAETTWLGVLVLGVSSVLGLIFILFVPDFPRALALVMPAFALVVMAAARWAFRGIFGMVRTRAVAEEDSIPVLVYGAGEAGTEVARLVATSPDARYRILGFLDDDRHKRFRRVYGHRVLGTGADLQAVVKQTRAEQVILAMGNPSPNLIQQISDDCTAIGAKLIVVPPVHQRIGGRVSLNELREFNVVDLLGRRQVETDLSDIAGLVTNKVVLITGAGGSIGSELSRQVHKLGPQKLFLLDRDESALHGVQLSIYGNGLLDTEETVLCDIRDLDALQRVIDASKPDVIFHAAALKHLPMLERFPLEGWKTNVIGSLNVLRCAAAAGVPRVVNVSTDKAADASSILGQSKRIAERLTSFYAMSKGLNYVSVRFGNVLGSRGSVIHSFKSQIERGGPITVTHPDVTRYFMTIPEACQLVLQAAAIGKPGDVLVLDMGEPVRIVDVAKRLIEVSGRTDVEIQFTGLRPGEKLHEVLFGELEAGVPSDHPLISQVTVPVLDPAQITFENDDREHVLDMLLSQAVDQPVAPAAGDEVGAAAAGVEDAQVSHAASRG
ncbi:MAG: nucleoside-diphosphate sugar epimerase/dehydratase [Propionibacteriaceae bacterium]|nr:nucleoside-diphosphate sugar epimerase/dehydratase [Propionibacteriaceae bacterium]